MSRTPRRSRSGRIGPLIGGASALATGAALVAAPATGWFGNGGRARAAARMRFLARTGPIDLPASRYAGDVSRTR